LGRKRWHSNGNERHHVSPGQGVDDAELAGGAQETFASPALTRFYALALTRIVELTAGHLHRDADNAYLTISRRRVILPPSLAQLIEEEIAAPPP
jgi:hypothetical protein